MNKKETSVIERVITSFEKLDENNKRYVMGLTEGMALVGGGTNGKNDRR